MRRYNFVDLGGLPPKQNVLAVPSNDLMTSGVTNIAIFVAKRFHHIDSAHKYAEIDIVLCVHYFGLMFCDFAQNYSQTLSCISFREVKRTVLDSSGQARWWTERASIPQTFHTQMCPSHLQDWRQYIQHVGDYIQINPIHYK